MAALFFHSTPWLGPSWDSVQLTMIETKDAAETQLARNFEPFADIQISSRQESHLESPMRGSGNIKENFFPFRLGVFLLELAFETPLKELRTPCDLVNGQEHNHIDYYTAINRQPEVAGRMNSIEYARMVKQCLKGNFPCGNSSLAETPLQLDVYRDVVSKLGKLEKRLRPDWIVQQA